MRKMKDSGVAWIGEIPLEYQTVSIGSLFSIKKDIIGHEPETVLSITQTGIKPKNLASNEGQIANSYSHYQIVNVGDFAMNHMDLLTGWVDISKFDGVTSPDYRVFTLNDKRMSAEYFLRVFQNYYYNRIFFGFGQGVATLGRWRLPTANFKKIIVPIPPLPEQDKIVSAIESSTSKVDALISNVQAQIEKLKAYKQSLITEVVTKGLDPNVPMMDSGVEWIGVVPKHWVIIPSKFLFENCDERRRENDVQLTASQKYGMISQKEYMRRENARIVLADKGLENWKHIEPFDFVISLRSFQGGLEMSEVSGCATWHYIVLRAQQKTHPYYYKWLFKSSMYITALQRTCNYIRDGQDLRYSNFVKVPLCIPTLEEQKQIADYLDKKCSEIDELIAVKQTKIEKLEQYKRSLIYEYVTGKKEVS